MASQDPIHYTLDDLFRHSPDCVLLLNRSRQLVFLSQNCRKLTGHNQDTLKSSSCACCAIMSSPKKKHGGFSTKPSCPCLRIILGEIPSHSERKAVRDQNSRRIWVETTYSPIKNEAGHVLAVILIMREITSRFDALGPDYEAEQSSPHDRLNALDVQRNAGYDEFVMDMENGKRSDPESLDSMLKSIEKREILLALHQTKGQRTRAARLLGISRSRLYRRMEALEIKL